MNEVFVLSCSDHMKGIYSNYRKAVQGLMMRAPMPITDFMSDFGMDFYTDGNGEVWRIEPKEVDKI